MGECVRGGAESRSWTHKQCISSLFFSFFWPKSEKRKKFALVIFCLSSLASSELIQLPLRPFREGSQKTAFFFFGEEELYPSLLGGSVFEPTKDYSSSKRHYDLLATNTKIKKLIPLPFFVTWFPLRKSPCKNIQKKKKKKKKKKKEKKEKKRKRKIKEK